MSDLILPIPAAFNTIAAARRFETRTVLLTWTEGGRFHQRLIRYRVMPFLGYTVAPRDVRGYLGLDEDELTDSEIDLNGAYLRLEDQVGRDPLVAAMSAGTILTVRANEALMLTAVIMTLPGVRLRASQSQENGSGDKRARFAAAPNWDALAAEAESRLALAVTTLQDGTSVNPTLLTLATPRNPYPLHYLRLPSGTWGF